MCIELVFQFSLEGLVLRSKQVADCSFTLAQDGLFDFSCVVFCRLIGVIDFKSNLLVFLEVVRDFNLSGEGGVQVVPLLFSPAHYLLLVINSLCFQKYNYQRVTLGEDVSVQQVSAADKKVKLTLKTV